MKKKERDPRINVSYMSLREFLLIFFIFSALNGFHMWLYQEFLIRGLFETRLRTAINIMIFYVAFAAALVTGITALLRHVSWSRPMRKLGEAANKIAQGDFSIRITPLRKDGKKDYVEVMFDDFNTMAQELQSIETLKNDFIANVSHEIKTPLAVIQNYAAVLQGASQNADTLSSDEYREYIKTIIDTSQKLSTMVSNILKLNKLENQKILPKPHYFNLGEQLRQCAVTFEELWESKNINFVSEIEDIAVCYDENMLEIVWNNLLSNAIKFTNPGGNIFVRLAAKGDPPDGIAQITVSDTGIGMDDETLKHIFDKFFQGDTSHSTEGNGLGLALVKQSIDLLGGNIEVESRNGQGTTFTVSLKI